MGKGAHGGRFQAQGTDIDARKKGGESEPWDQEKPHSKADGTALIAALEKKCTASERTVREKPFLKARSRVETMDYDVVKAGKPFIKSFYCRNAPHSDMRVDIEIRRGRAWSP